MLAMVIVIFFFSSRRRHTRLTCDWSSDVCSSDLFFRGPGSAQATGYGIFPASFRDHLAGTGSDIDWSSSDYAPLADVTDSPGDTLPGLNSSGVTLELGGLWDPTVAGASPGPSGTLCALQLSQPARVSVSANLTRGGVISAFPGTLITP